MATFVVWVWVPSTGMTGSSRRQPHLGGRKMFLRWRHRIIRGIAAAAAVAALAAPLAQARVDETGGTATRDAQPFSVPAARIDEIRGGDRGGELVSLPSMTRPDQSWFDWSSAGIGLGAGVALAFAAGGLIALRRRSKLAATV
jgi:hypothetical protein